MNCLLGETKSTTSQNSATTAPTASNKIKQEQFTSNSLNINQNNSSVTNSNNSSSSLNSQETCLICGDVASGKHYGLRSCEACKAFFKRTVQGKIEYSCPATRECEINKRRRKACQACRFQKCLNMGMLKEGVRLDRVRGGRQKYRRGLSPMPPNDSGIGANCSNATSSSSQLLTNNVSNNSATNSFGRIAQASNVNQHNSTISLIGCPTNNNNLGNSETNRIMTALINCEPEELNASPAQYVTNIPSTLSVQMKTLYILSDLFDRELVSLIGWAKQIPGFSETVTLNDQMRLLQSTWAEVIALSIGYRSHTKRIDTYKQQQQQQFQQQPQGNGSYISFINSTPSPTSSSPASTASSYNHSLNSSNNSLENTEIKLVFAKDLIIDFKHAVTCGMEEIFYNCVQLVKRLDCLRITPKEYILLKAISLTNADVRLENPQVTHQLRDLIMDTLYDATIADLSNVSSVPMSSQKDNNGNNISLTSNSHQLKLDAQEGQLSSTPTKHYASTPLSRPSSSVLSSSSLSPISPQNTNNSNNIDAISKKTIINHRLNQVLLCLPVLRQIDSCIRKFWNDVRKGPNIVPMNKLFEEMLEPCQRIYKSSTDM